MQEKKRVKLSFPEQSAIFYPDAKDPEAFLGIDCCAVCGSKEKLYDCSTCHKISYCSKKHETKDKNIHSRVCGYLSTLNSDELKPVSSEILEKSLQATSIEEMEDSWESVITKKEMNTPIGRAMTSFLSYPCTLLHVLDSLNMDEIHVIHVIGASEHEIQHLSIWKYLFTLHEKLVLYFIGPTLGQNVKHSQENGGSIFIHGMKYDELLSKKKMKTPDLIVGFHLGLTIDDYDWEASLKAMSQSNSRILLTGFCRDEILMDYCELEPFGYKITAGPIENPFSSTTIEQSGTLANDIYKKNLYYLVLDK